MSLKAIFNTMKKEGYVVKKLDQYLLSLNKEVSDRAINVNSPSQVGNCLRANYFARLHFPQDSNAIDPRSRRILDNGTKVHERLQEYLVEANILVNDEIPLRNDSYLIQGHTDGFINLLKPRIKISEEIDYLEIANYLNIVDKLPAHFEFKKEVFEREIASEIGILEIKSINSGNFSTLKDAKDNHKLQGMVYLFCAEERRKEIQSKYSTYEEFANDLGNRVKYYASLYNHLESGRKYTREEKLLFKVIEHIKADLVLYHTPRPINKVVFLYENKDTQDLKEFTVQYDNEMIKDILARYEILNKHVDIAVEKAREEGFELELDSHTFNLSEELMDFLMEYAPEREGNSKNSTTCRWCNFREVCFPGF